MVTMRAAPGAAILSLPRGPSPGPVPCRRSVGRTRVVGLARAPSETSLRQSGALERRQGACAHSPQRPGVGSQPVDLGRGMVIHQVEPSRFEPPHGPWTHVPIRGVAVHDDRARPVQLPGPGVQLLERDIDPARQMRPGSQLSRQALTSTCSDDVGRGWSGQACRCASSRLAPNARSRKERLNERELATWPAPPHGPA
jgi:hypothetical protein